MRAWTLDAARAAIQPQKDPRAEIASDPRQRRISPRPSPDRSTRTAYPDTGRASRNAKGSIFYNGRYEAALGISSPVSREYRSRPSRWGDHGPPERTSLIPGGGTHPPPPRGARARGGDTATWAPRPDSSVFVLSDEQNRPSINNFGSTAEESHSLTQSALPGAMLP